MGVLCTEAMTYLMGDGRDVADSPGAAFECSRSSTAELCHTVSAQVGLADQYAKVVVNGIVA